MSQRVLVLNGNYQPLGVVVPQRAIKMVLAKKAEVLEEGNDYFHSEKMMLPRPNVIRLLKVHKVPYRRRLPVTRRSVVHRDKGICGYCGGKADTIDHIKPKAQGGKHTWRNVAAACRPCNGKKRDRTPEEAGMKLRIKPFEPEGEIAFKTVFKIVEVEWERYLGSPVALS